MNEITAEKFADLMAKCAVSGDLVDLRKEAAAQELIKSANPWMWALPAAGALAGGATGYFGTQDEKRKKRNALYGLLTGGTLGLGGALLSTGNKITSDATTGMANINAEADAKINPPDAAGKPKDTGLLTTPAGQFTPLGNVAAVVPGLDAALITAAGPDHPLHTSNVNYGDINPLNVPGRVVGGAAGATVGLVGHTLGNARHNAAARAAAQLEHARNISREFLKTPAGKVVSDILGRIRADSAAPGRIGLRGAVARAFDLFRSRPRGGIRGSAADAMGVAPYTTSTLSGRLRSLIPQLRTQGYRDALAQNKTLAEVARTGVMPTTANRANQLRAALERVGAESAARKVNETPLWKRPVIKDPRARGYTPSAAALAVGAKPLPPGERHMTRAEYRRSLTPKIPSDSLLANVATAANPRQMSPSKMPTPRRGGKLKAVGTGGFLGSLLAHPYLTETLLNFMYGDKLTENMPEVK